MFNSHERQSRSNICLIRAIEEQKNWTSQHLKIRNFQNQLKKKINSQIHEVQQISSKKKKKTKCKLSQIVKMAEHQRFLITQKTILEEKQLH